MFSVLFLIWSGFFFLVGAVFGSFLNVLLARSSSGEQWLWGRSRCDFCQKPLKWFWELPVISFVVLRGRSGCCDRELSLSHPVVELLMGSLFMWWYWSWTLFFHLTQAPFQVLQLVFWLVVGVILVTIVVIDWAYLIIPDALVLALTFLALGYRMVLTAGGIMQQADFMALMAAALGASSFLGAIWLLTRGRGLGLGDVKLAVPMALLVGWPNILVAMFLAFLVGAVVGVGMLLTGKVKFGQPIPFGPFLVVGIFGGLVLGDQLLGWYLGLL